MARGCWTAGSVPGESARRQHVITRGYSYAPIFTDADGDASQHQSAMRRKDILHHLNPQLKKLMNEGDFAGTQPFLFGEDFGVKAKEKLDAAAALRKVVYQQPAKQATPLPQQHQRTSQDD